MNARVEAMQTRIQELPVPAVAAGGLALLGGVAVWQLGMEFERVWMRSYEGPLEGETPAGVGDDAPLAGDEAGEAPPRVGARRRWVASSRPRVAPRVRLT
jgi:hypothetical protein